MTEALALLDRALDFLNAADVASLPAQVQAGTLRALERAESKHTAVRARVLSAFSSQDGHYEDGAQTARTWLVWHTRVSRGAAAGAVGWSRRLREHPVIEAAQPTRLIVHMTLSELRGLPGAGETERAWAAAQAVTGPGWLTGPEAAACDATIVPVVTGHVDPAALDQLTETVQAHRDGTTDHAGHDGAIQASPNETSQAGRDGASRASLDASSQAGRDGTSQAFDGGTSRLGGDGSVQASDWARRSGALRANSERPGDSLAPATRERLRRALLALAAQTLSGPGGLAAHLRTSLVSNWPEGGGSGSKQPEGAEPESGSPAAREPGSTEPGSGPRGRLGRGPWYAGMGRSRAGKRAALSPGAGLRRPTSWPPPAVSLPLDIGEATVAIPAHIRRAVGIRHRFCAFPGCGQPLRVCDLHHVIPRSRGGPTALHNLLPLCPFHHLTVIHRWGWTLRMEPDGSTVAASPDGTRTLHSHSPPELAA